MRLKVGAFCAILYKIKCRNYAHRDFYLWHMPAAAHNEGVRVHV